MLFSIPSFETSFNKYEHPLWHNLGRLSSLVSLLRSSLALEGPDFYSQTTEMCGEAKNEKMMLIRVFGIAARGTALIAVNGKGNFYDPPVQVGFSLSTPLWIALSQK